MREKNDFYIFVVTLTFDLLTSNVQIRVSTKYEFTLALRFRENRRHGRHIA